jgi:PAS domain S-box-containing protein
MSASASGKTVVVALPMPQGLSQTTVRIRSGAEAYWKLFRTRSQIRTIFFLMLLLITVFVFFSSVWLALFLSKQITQPVEALADAMDQVAAGKYDHRVAVIATGEMGELVRVFNHMAADLDTSRQLAETSSAQLSAANLSIEERRRELETIVETIPSGVVTLDGANTVLLSNRAFAALMGRREDIGLRGEKIESFLPADCADDLDGVIRRCHRMGVAATEIEFHARGRTVHLAITSARKSSVVSIWPLPARGSNWPTGSKGPFWWWRIPPSFCARSGSWRGKRWRSASPTRSRIRLRPLRFLPSGSAGIWIGPRRTRRMSSANAVR